MAAFQIIRQIANQRRVRFEKKVGMVWKPWDHKLHGATHMSILTYSRPPIFTYIHAGAVYNTHEEIPLRLSDTAARKFSSYSPRLTRTDRLIPRQKLLELHKYDMLSWETKQVTHHTPITLKLFRKPSAFTILVEYCPKRSPPVTTMKN